jgi:hypothetical protein
VGFEDPGDPELFEREVVRCASLLVRRVRAGASCTLRMRGVDYPVLHGAGLDEALRALALVEVSVSRETAPPPRGGVSRETVAQERSAHLGAP